MLPENRVTIVKFTNPHRFWIRFTQNAETLANFENDLCELFVKSRSAQAKIGDYIAVKDLETYKRGTVKEITASGYLCRLLDYPDTIIVDNVYKLPQKYIKIPPMINLACLSNTVPIKKVLNVETSDITFEATSEFTSSCLRQVEDLLRKPTETVFLTEFIVKGVLCGCLLLRTDAGIVNLAQYLVQRNCVTENKELFLEVFARSNGSMSSKGFDKPAQSGKDNVQNSEGVGRGCTRKSQRAERLMATASRSDDKREFVKEWIGSLDSNASCDDSESNRGGLSTAQSMSDVSDISDRNPKKPLVRTDNTPPKKHRLSSSEIAKLLSNKDKIGNRSREDTKISESERSSDSGTTERKRLSSSEVSKMLNDQTTEKSGKTRLSASEIRRLLTTDELSKSTSTGVSYKPTHVKFRKDGTKPCMNNVETNPEVRPLISTVIKNSFTMKEINKMSARHSENTELPKKRLNVQISQESAVDDSTTTTDTSSYDKEPLVTEGLTSSDCNSETPLCRNKKETKKKPAETEKSNSSSENECNDAPTTSTTTTTSDETKADDDEHEFKGVVMKNSIHSFCKCASCLKWLDKDEDQTVFVGEEKSADIEVFRGSPQPLIRLSDGDGVVSAPQLVVRKGSGREGATKVEKDMTPSILVHGPGHIPTPVSDIQKLPFCPPVHRALRECGVKTVSEMQTYVWPALMRSMNVCVVNSSGSGKTLCYLPALASFIVQKKERYPFLPREPSPIAVILCDGINRAEETYGMLTKFLHNTRRRVNCYLLVPPINRSEFKYLKSADILVTTPKVLVRILSSRQINLKRLCHLVVEDIDVILERTSGEFHRLIRGVQTMLNHRVYVNSVQIVTTSKRWTQALEAFIKKLAVLPMVCIGSHLESVLYGRANIKMHFVKCEKKKTDIAEILKEEGLMLKTLVVCNTDDEVMELAEHLQVQGVSAIGVTESMLREEIEEREITWMMTPDKKNSALICTDLLLHTQLSVTTARMLIHYSLPDASWTAFARRFRSVLDVHDSPFSTKFSKANACSVHIFVDESCNKQFPRLHYFLKQLGAKLPEKFTQFCKQLEDSEEQDKIDALRRVCKRLKLLGACDKFRCKKRHVFSSDLDVSPDIPTSGIVKFKLLHAQDVTHYGIRLLEHTDTERNVRPVPNYEAFVTADLKVAVDANRLLVMNVAVGGQYAYFDAENVTYRRCKVLRVLSSHKITNSAHQVKVRFIDDGMVKSVFASLLYELPNQYLEFPPQSIDARLVNIVPLEGDTKWNRRTKSKLDNLLTDYQTRYPEAYCTGTILLQIGGTVYLDDVKIRQDLDSVGETVTLLSLKKKLNEMELIDHNENVLTNLRSIWVNSGLELPNYEMKPLPKKIIKIDQLKPDWAFMDSSPDVYNQVYFMCGTSPDKFYVRLAKNDILFVNLQEDIQEALLKPFYPEIRQLTVGHCYLAKDPEGDGYGRIIVRDIEGDSVDCFFVDFGDSVKVRKDELKFLSDELIRKLPFQAIECSLYGITSIYEDWPNDAVDVLYKYTFEPDTDLYRDLNANVIRSETSTFGNTKYSVVLVDNFTGNFTLLNKIIVDCGFAIDKPDEKLDDVTLPELKVIADIEEEEDIEEPSMIPAIEIDPDKFKEVALASDDLNIDDVELSLLDGAGFDFFIQDFQSFMNEISKAKFDTTAKNEVTSTKDKDSARPTTNNAYVPMKAMPPVNYKTPDVLWHQHDKLVKLEIFVADVKEYTLHVLRFRNVVFRTNVKNQEYKLNFNLYDSVVGDVQHTLHGGVIRVVMTKKREEEWPRLTSNTEKQRNIKYDLRKLECDEEDRTKKKRRFLELDDGLEDEDTDEEFGPTYIVQGSDTSDSEDSHCYDDVAM